VTNSFQSQLGSIGATEIEELYLQIPEFQSQLGSIGAQGLNVTPLPDRRCFNPSLVRLAHAMATAHSIADLGFNPSLVRLAPVPILLLWGPLGMFQSQLGSIGAGIPPSCPGASAPFQSQLGSIGALLTCHAPPAPQPVSIPAWFDWRGRGVEGELPGLVRFQSQLGSIGAWTSSSGQRRTTASFNPSLVRLARI